MKSLTQYFFEKLDEKQISKASDKLLNELQNHAGNLSEFVKALNSALKNADSGDNAALWIAAIKDLFDGEKGEQYKAKNNVAVKIADLYPTQSEIDIANSAKWATKDWGAKGVADMFKGEAFGKSFPVPVLVYKADGKNWIIDGHHRWSQVGLINPEASLNCLVVEGPETVQNFLKLTQGAIAGVLATDNNNKGKKGDRQLPVGKANPDNNIFGPKLKGEKLKDKIVEMLNENKNIAEILFETLKKATKTDKEINAETVGTLVMKNRDKMIENGQNPPKWAAPRPVMPQSDAAGPNDPNDAKDGNPDNEGSALYAILHHSKFPNLSK